MAARVLLVATSTESAIDVATSEALVERLSPLVVVPRFAEMKQAIAHLSSYRTIAFTSAHGVDALVGALRSLGHDVRALFGIVLAVVGAGTAARLERYGLAADLVADGGGDKLAQEILASGCPDPILYPRAAEGHPALIEALTAAGRRIDAVAAYDTRPDTAALKAAVLRHAERPYAAFAFASPKGANVVIDAFGASRMQGALIGAIGATTRDALAARGFADVVVPERPSLSLLTDLLRQRIEGTE